jgi:hypothetical protein
VVLDQLTVLDHASPGPRLVFEQLDERLETMKIGPRGTLDMAHSAGRLLDQ